MPGGDLGRFPNPYSTLYLKELCTVCCVHKGMLMRAYTICKGVLYCVLLCVKAYPVNSLP